MSTKARETKPKINKWDNIKLKSFQTAKKNYQQQQKNNVLSASGTFNKGFISKIIKNSYNSTTKSKQLN